MDPWFAEQTAGLIGGIIGSSLGITGGIVGSTCWFFIQKGWKKLVLGTFIFFIAVCALLLAGGVAAFVLKQPYHVWYCFALPGFIGTAVFSGLLPVMRNRFIERETKQMEAQDL